MNDYAYYYTKRFEKYLVDAPLLKYFLTLLNVKNPVLEIGAGPVRHLDLLSSFDSYFIDKSSEMKREFVLRGGNSERYYLTDMSKFNSSFKFSGVFILLNSLAEFSDQYFTLTKIYELLDDNGKILINMLNPKHKSIYRTINWYKIDGLDYRTRSFPIKEYGLNGAQTILEVKDNEYKTFHVDQNLIDYETMVKWLTEVGFIINETRGYLFDEEFVENESLFYNVIATKGVKKKIVIPKNEIEVTEQRYDQYAPSYDKDSIDIFKYKVPEWLTSNFSDPETNYFEILDLACGTGTIAELLKNIIRDKSKISFTGVDLSDEMLRVARDKNLYDICFKWNLNNLLPLQRYEKYQVVTAFGLFDFLEDPMELLQQLNNLMSYNARIYTNFEALSPTTSLGYPQNKYFNEVMKIHHYRYTHDEVVKMLKNSGFTVEVVEEKNSYYRPICGKWMDYHFVKAIKNLK